MPGNLLSIVLSQSHPGIYIAKIFNRDAVTSFVVAPIIMEALAVVVVAA